jgi:hypothetical protein
LKAIVTGTSISSTLDPTKTLTATTFANATADFAGISSVVLGAGESGKTTAIVNWVAATTTGSIISPKPTDPVQYEVKYISQLGGAGNLNNDNYLGPDKKSIKDPDPLTAFPSLSNSTSMTIPNLNSGTTYYFQVRAIHKNYALYGSDKTYKSEANTKYLSIKTLDSSGVFDFKSNQVMLTSPIGQDGLTNLNVAWLPASGAFDHYRVCYTKVFNATDTVAVIDDQLVDNDAFPISVDSASTFCFTATPNDTFFQLTNLASYAYYQVKVIACQTFNCLYKERVMSTVMQKRVTTNIAPFGGILAYENPSNENFLTNVILDFNPAITSAGYINEFRLYCYSSLSDTNPVRVDDKIWATGASGKSNCDNITVISPLPYDTTSFDNFHQLELSLPAGGIDGAKQYCFSLVPTIVPSSGIDSAIYPSEYIASTQSDVANAVVKCFIPQVKTPNILQFAGRNPLCNLSNSNKDIQITWDPAPTGGLYSSYVVFYQAKLNGNEFFDFPTAVAAYGNGAVPTQTTPVSGYSWSTVSKGLTSQDIPGLIPGTKYNIGVLPYLVGSNNPWGQFNYNTGECSLPFPTAKFEEWMQVFAVGPKEDGLTPMDQGGSRKYILETLNADDQPVEIITTGIAPNQVPDPSDDLAKLKTTTGSFDGIYGRYNALSTSPINQFSNSGIVKLMWQDVSLYQGTDSLALHNDTLTTKNNHKYGYRVYRSDDNKLTWKDLSSYSVNNPNQTSANAGLIQSTAYAWTKRNNIASISDKVASFTDYSVKFSTNNGETDRARIYYYKIVPVFNGVEIFYDDITNPNHNVIKVILPPRNMALVNRSMANKTICEEMNLPIKKGVGEFYSCNYDGVGAKGLNPPYSKGSTVYDLGGDLLIDRFELGVPFTRGDPVASNSNSETANTVVKSNFTGMAANGNKYKGCFNSASAGNNFLESSQGSPLLTGNYSNNTVMHGDCVGQDLPIKASDSQTICQDPLHTSSRMFIYPGANGANLLPNCASPQETGFYLTDLSHNDTLIATYDNYAQTQSEFAAIYFMRNGNGNYFNGETASLYNIPVANSKVLIADARVRLPLTYINFPYMDSATNPTFMTPRWLPINRLFGNYSIDNKGAGFSTAKSITLFDKTISDITNPNLGLYDLNSKPTGIFAPPSSLITSSRFNNTTTTIARLFSSNASKLPPLQGLSQTQFHKVCSTYKVDVGIETLVNGYAPIINYQNITKRLMRKKESTIAAAWPNNSLWNDVKVTNIENGSDATLRGCNSRLKTRPNGTANLSLTSPLDNYIPWANSTSPITLTGSNGINSSENCTSKFGIQDIVGNVREHNSDTIYCSYLSDTNPNKPVMYVSQEAVGAETAANSVDYSKVNGFNYFDISSSGPLHAWVYQNADSGTCSVDSAGVETGNYLNGSIFSSIYLPGSKTVDSSVVTYAKSFDQDSVLASRNGDGTFLNFGSNNLGPVLNTVDAFNKPSLYFNVPLGIPLKCDNGCNTSTGGGSGNKIAATSASGLTTALINDFPTNNAKFTNYGVADMGKWASVSTNNMTAGYQYVDGISINANPSNNDVHLSAPLTGPSSSPGLLYNYSWNIDRGSPMRFTTGGSAQSDAGRYTFFLDGPKDSDDRAVSDTGARCAILIEE